MATQQYDLFTVAEAAEELQVNDSRVRQLIHSGQLEAIKLGDQWFIEGRTLRAFAKLDRPSGRPKMSD